MPEWDITNLYDFLAAVLQDYPTPDETFTHKSGQPPDYTGEDLRVGKNDLEAYRDLVKDDGTRVVTEALDDAIYDLSAPRQPNLAHIPYVAIMDPVETTSTKYGRYVVYLVDPTNDTAYLTLAIGASSIETLAKDIRSTNETSSNPSDDEILTWLATWYRTQVEHPDGFSIGPITFPDNLNRGDAYGNGTIIYKAYDRTNLPSNHDLVDDLNALVDTYQDLLNTTTTPLDTSLGDATAWHFPVEDDTWETWGSNGIATLSAPELQSSLTEGGVKRPGSDATNAEQSQSYEPGDVVVATTAPDDGLVVYGVGEVTSEPMPPQRRELEDEVDSTIARVLGIEWYAFPVPVPITLGHENPLSDRPSALEEFEFDHVLGTTLLYAIAGGLYDDFATVLAAITDTINLEIGHTANPTRDDPSNGRPTDGPTPEIDDPETTTPEPETPEGTTVTTWSLDEVEWTSPNFDKAPEDIDLEGLYFEDQTSLLADALDALEREKHVLFVGPPGTGKSKLARELASALVHDAYEMTTATADWSTFDTIGGYRQQTSGELEFTPGLFLSRFQDGEGRPTNEWLIVDEFNRANIDKAFGSLFSVLADDDVVLPFTDGHDRDITVYGSTLSSDTSVGTHEYVVPDEWRLLATMNTFDKSSLYDLSYALSRRFSYIHVPAPEPGDITQTLLTNYTECWPDVTPTSADVSAMVELWTTIQHHRPLGPAIVRDVLAAKDGKDFTPGVIQHVLPQFEGLMKRDQEALLKDIAALESIDSDDVGLVGRQYFELTDLDL